MTAERAHSAAYEVTIEAPAGVVRGLVADATRWPSHLPACVHVEQLDHDGHRERIRIWAVVAGRVRCWISCRTHRPGGHTVEFHQERPTATVRALSGAWTVRPLGAGRSVLGLAYECVLPAEGTGRPGGGPDGSAPFDAHAFDAVAVAQLKGLRETAERWADLDELALSFEESVRVSGPPELVYDVLYRVRDWPALLPHVAGAVVTEDEPGVQLVSAHAFEADGRAHRTESVRLCFPHAGRIVHKQTVPPPLLAAHTGEWSVVSDPAGVTVSARHSVVLREADIVPVLGAGAGPARARRQVREALGRTSAATLDLAKRHAESAVTMLGRTPSHQELEKN